MLVGQGLTVTLYIKTGLVSTLTPLGLTVTTLLTVSSKGKGKVLALVTLLEQPLLLHLTLVSLQSSKLFHFYKEPKQKKKLDAHIYNWDVFFVFKF